MKHSTDITIHDHSGIFTFAKTSGGNVFRFKQQWLEYSVKKTIIKSLSTDKRKCYNKLYYGQASCIEDLATKRFFDRTTCILPWMKLLIPDADICEAEDSLFKDALQEYACSMSELSGSLYKNVTEYEHFCSDFESVEPLCHNIRSCLEIVVEKSIKKDRITPFMNVLQLKWENPRVMYVEEFISYDLHNFIGEVGGFFGLFLGFSFTSLFVLLEWLHRRIRNHTLPKNLHK